MSEWLSALCFGFISALVPVFNAEVYVGVAAANVSGAAAVSVAICLSIGQTVGKLVWYFAARTSIESRWVQKKLDRPRTRRRFDRWRDRLQSRPVFALLVLLASSFLGFPPLLVLAVVAGSVRIPVVAFALTCLLGRSARFVALALSAGWTVHLL